MPQAERELQEAEHQEQMWSSLKGLILQVSRFETLIWRVVVVDPLTKNYFELVEEALPPSWCPLLQRLKIQVVLP